MQIQQITYIRVRTASISTRTYQTTSLITRTTFTTWAWNVAMRQRYLEPEHMIPFAYTTGKNYQEQTTVSVTRNNDFSVCHYSEKGACNG